eukprot:gene44291-59981_t
MFGALRMISVQQGYDPRDFALMGFGGAGPLHVNAVARLMGSYPAVSPVSPGVLAVMQGDADRDLDQFPTGAFDYAVLSQTLQATRNPRQVLSELLRIADRAVVSFPNFGHWRVRWSLLSRGRMPETRSLPEPWWSTMRGNWNGRRARSAPS